MHHVDVTLEEEETCSFTCVISSWQMWTQRFWRDARSYLFFFFMVGCREAAHAAVWSCPCLQCHSGRRRTHATWSQCLLNFSFSLRLTQICICRKRKVVQRLWWNPPFTVDGVDVLSSYKWAISFSHSLLMLQTLRFSAEMLWYCITIWDFCQVLPFRQHIWRTGAFKHGNCLVPS